MLSDTNRHQNQDREELVDLYYGGRKSFVETNQAFDALRGRRNVRDYCNILEYVRNKRAGRKRKVVKTFGHNI